VLIVHLTASRFFGGPERQMLDLAKALPPEIRSLFVSFSETGLCRAFLEQARTDGFEGVALRRDTPHLLAALNELMAVLRRLGANVLCCHGYKANLLGLLAARRLGIPVISVSRGWTGESARVRFYEALDGRILRWMDKVVCVSHGQAAKVHKAGVREHKISVIHNAVRPERFDNPDPAYREQLRRMFPKPPQQIVGAAGRLSPEKGFDVLIDAAAQVLNSPPASLGRKTGGEGTIPVGFILFGDGPLRDALAQQIAARGLEGRFILAGFRSDLDRYLPHLDLFVQSSHTEGLPNVILEAFAARVPVVATAVGGTPEVVEDGATGILVPADDPSALAAAIARLVADEPLRRAMGTAGRCRVEAEFTFTAQAEAYRRLLASLDFAFTAVCQPSLP